jgi:hypothetical protein
MLSPPAFSFLSIIKDLGPDLKQAMRPSLETGAVLDGLVSENHRTDFGAGL